jgi:hypothetical protein
MKSREVFPFGGGGVVKTTAQVVDDAGNPVGIPLVSGEGPISQTISEFLRRSSNVEHPGPGKLHPAAAHPETRIAWAMRQRHIPHAHVVINHRDGVCEGMYSCRIAVPAILRPGQSMTVWHRGPSGRLESTPLGG